MAGTGLFVGESFNLDFHSVPYYGDDPVLERHYVAARSRRQPSVLVFLAQDAAGRAFCYSNADLRKGEEAEEIFAFISFWHSSSVGLKVDFDMALLVLASGLYRLLAQQIRGYSDAQARQIFRNLVDMPANVTIGSSEVEVSFHRRAHLPIILASGLMDKPVPVPWWNGLPLRLTTYKG